MTAEFISGLIGPIEPNRSQLIIQHRSSTKKDKTRSSFKKIAFAAAAASSSSNLSPTHGNKASSSSMNMRSFKKTFKARMSYSLKRHRRRGSSSHGDSSVDWQFPVGGIAGSYDIRRLIMDKVYNKLKPDDPDKVVDCESQDEPLGYEFSTTQIKEFRKVFNAFDRDGNDSIGTEELGPVLSALGYSPSDSDIQKVLSRFDTDSSGDLSFEEYLALMAVWVEEDETQIIEAFKVFDKSGDGFVTITELKRALCRFGEKFSEEEADEFFALIDVNKDGIINYEEFVKYMLSEINRGPPPRAVRT